MSLVELRVDGQDISIDLDAELEIGDVSSDMDQIAAQMAYWGSVWAAAEYERVRVEAHYRQWRAQRKQAISQQNTKLAEWKVTQEIQSDPDYVKLYRAQAEAVKNSTLAKSIFEAHRIKANMLQSKGAMMRSELDATGMSTKKTKTKTKTASDHRVAAMKNTFGKGKKKGKKGK